MCPRRINDVNNQRHNRCGYRVMFLVVLFSCLIFIQTSRGISEPIEMDQSLRVTSNESLSYIDENLIIEGNIEVRNDALLLFQDCNITLLWSQMEGKPNILVSDNGVLRLENSTVWVRLDTEHYVSTSGEITIQDQAKLIVDNSTIQSTDNFFMWIRDNASVNFSGSTFSGKAPKSSMHWFIEELMPEGAISELHDDYYIYVMENAVFSAGDSVLGVVDLSDDTECNIANSRIALLSPYSSKETLCTMSEIIILSTSQRNASFTFTGTLSGYYERFVLEEELGSDKEGNLLLMNCSIEKIRLSLIDCKSEFKDAEVWQLTVSGGETRISDSEITIANLYYGDATITDSVIPYLLGNCRDGKLRVSGCECPWVNLLGYNIDGVDHIWAEFNDTEIGDCVINYMSIVEEADFFFRDVSLKNIKMKSAQRFNLIVDNLIIENSTTITSLGSYPIVLRGAVEFLRQELKVHQYAILRREYQIQVLEKGIPAPEKLVELHKGSEMIATATTDQCGLVFFNVSWSEGRTPGVYVYDEQINDVAEELTLLVEGVEIKIGVLSDTPVAVELNEQQLPLIYPLIITTALVLSIALMFRWKRL